MVRHENESIKEFMIRVIESKEELGLSWNDIADIINENTDSKLAPSTYRMWWKHYSEGYRDAMEHLASQGACEQIEELQVLKYQIQDQKRELNQYLRHYARDQHILEEIRKSIESLPPIELEYKSNEDSSYQEGLLLLSDLHFGMEVENSWNKYNEDVFKQRLESLLQQVIDYSLLHKINTIHIMNLGDIVNGTIHVSTRIQSTEDVISQVMKVSEYLTQFIYKISKYIPEVKFYSCIGNHDRVSYKSKDAELHRESYGRLIPWYLESRFRGIPYVSIVPNEYGDDVIVADICGQTIFGVHGHQDRVASATKLTFLLNKIPSMIVMGHYHHSWEKEIQGIDVVVNPSFCGMDEYAKGIRAISKPRQKFMIMDEKGRLCTYDIRLE